MLAEAAVVVLAVVAAAVVVAAVVAALVVAGAAVVWGTGVAVLSPQAARNKANIRARRLNFTKFRNASSLKDKGT